MTEAKEVLAFVPAADLIAANAEIRKLRTDNEIQAFRLERLTKELSMERETRQRRWKKLLSAMEYRVAADAEIERLRAENERLKEALGYFLNDDRFQVSVGGNPNAVHRMLVEARAALNGSEG